MKVSLGWLSDFVDIDMPVERLVHALDMSGTKVEAVHRPGQETKGIIVAQVVSVEAHPNADTLSLVDVDTGDGQQRVVCGAKNFSVGDRVPLARVGSRLPEMEITARKIRGIVSDGMLCSGSELGISKDHSGILVLPPDAQLGADVVETLGLGDAVLELEITPNRPDCMSVIGVAREIAAVTNMSLRAPSLETPAPEPAGPVTVTIQDDEGCRRYLAQYIKDIVVRPSPAHIASRLLACGVRPISNVVDATNYVMLETGQPLHAFDADLVHGQAITVRRAVDGERFTTLDGVIRHLSDRDLMIADGDRALGIAGVMGGANSEISPQTKRLILEAASFEKVSVAYTSRRHGLRTEASARFERGVDPDGVPVAAARATAMILELAGGEAPTGPVDEYPRPPERATITLRPGRSNRLLGIEIPAASQADYLRRLGLYVEERQHTLEVEVPTFRPDLTREEDLVEEVARLEGFVKLPATLPGGPAGRLHPDALADRKIRRALAAMGLHEIWTSSFMSLDSLDKLGLDVDHPARHPVMLSNPMSEEETALRTTLMPGLLKTTAHNLARGVKGAAFFEIARVYEPTVGASPKEQLPQEGLVLGAIFSGESVPKTWWGQPAKWDYFAVKGVLERMLQAIGAPAPRFRPVRGMPFHPTRAAAVSFDRVVAGALGELHPEACERFEVPEGTLLLEIALAPVLAALPEDVKVEDVPRFPANLIDLAFVVDEEITADRIEELVGRAGQPEVSSVRLFDVYRGDQVPEGKKSLAYALELRLPDRSLTDEEATRVRDRIVAVLRERAGAELRA
jgi:phenylalanyl-tRNA synthetase beta chain